MDISALIFDISAFCEAFLRICALKKRKSLDKDDMLALEKGKDISRPKGNS